MDALAPPAIGRALVSALGRSPAKLALIVSSVALALFSVISVADIATTERLFLGTTYYLLMATLLCWVGTYLHVAGAVRPRDLGAWLKESWPGLLVALVVTVIAGFAIEPALRMLSDEANLAGTAKNLFASKAPTFTVSGKYYYESFWDVDVAIDRRPTLFPFLVSLVHALAGYSYRNVFAFNLAVLPAFLWVSYRLAKSLAGETFAVVASILVAAHPATLLAVRSGGFDFFATFFALLVVKSLHDYTREQTPGNLAILWLNLCLFAEIRYESALFIAPVVALLLVFGMVRISTLRPYAFIYAATPIYLLPRIWQGLLRGNVPEQEAGAVTFSLDNFINNLREYFAPVLSPTQSFPAHSGLLIALGLVGCGLWLRWIWRRLRAQRDWRAPDLRFPLSCAAWMVVQAVISFTYVWGRAQYPSSARLVIAFDTFFSFAAAWAISLAFKRSRPFIPVLLAAALLTFQVPVASQHRMLNRLTQTRESAALWRFFEGRTEKRILIVTDRPNHFTILDYGAMSFDSARRDPHLLTAFARHLMQDIYVIQRLKLSTNEPLPGYEIWPNRKLDPVLEFQNDADVLVRVSRLSR